jgi:hypothetical protein
LRGFFDMDPADYDEAANNLSNFTVLERTVFDPEDGPQPDPYTIGRLAAMDPAAVRALAAQIENDPTGSVYSPELVDMLADMTPQELEEITGLPIAGAGTGFQQTPFDPNDIDFGPDMDQIAAGGTNPWTNVQGAEDLAANYLPAPPPQIDIAPNEQAILNALQNAPPLTAATDPFRGLPGTRVLNETAPAAALPEANPYMPTDRDFQIPQTWMDQGIAGAYSRSGRAADRLGQPQYTDIESLRRELEKHGAAPGELRYQLDQFEEAMLDGPLSREDIQRFFSDRDTGLSIDRNLSMLAAGCLPAAGMERQRSITILRAKTIRRGQSGTMTMRRGLTMPVPPAEPPRLMLSRFSTREQPSTILGSPAEARRTMLRKFNRTFRSIDRVCPEPKR